MNSGWRFAHIGMVVRDLEASRSFYEGLGFESQGVRDLAIPEGALMVNAEPSKTEIKLKICDVSGSGITIELIEPVAGEFVHMEWLKREGEGVNHIFFTVDDLSMEKAKLIDGGFPFLFGDDGFAFFDTTGIGNLLLELGQG